MQPKALLSWEKMRISSEGIMMLAGFFPGKPGILISSEKILALHWFRNIKMIVCSWAIMWLAAIFFRNSWVDGLLSSACCYMFRKRRGASWFLQIKNAFFLRRYAWPPLPNNKWLIISSEKMLFFLKNRACWRHPWQQVPHYFFRKMLIILTWAEGIQQSR